MFYQFITKSGEYKTGLLWKQYKAFEGEMRYIIFCDGKEYRCIKNDKGEFVEK